MSDSYNDRQQNSRNFEASREGGPRGGFRGGRGQSNRDGGGFRIRLSENEMRSARLLQEAFNLRSTVAVLGFALRTLGQMLEEGKLDELINEYQNQASNGNNRRPQDSRNNRFNGQREASTVAVKANPFERPSKPSSSDQNPAESKTENSSEKENSIKGSQEESSVENPNPDLSQEKIDNNQSNQSNNS
tara:strand:- start:1332 stop:1898 length:567 start_codon:yes stop_codon:yes gene_type:complete